MRELSLHILDIAENSFEANATLVGISVTQHDDYLSLFIYDNGDGMDKEFLKTVDSPYQTTKKGKKVGMGIPLLKASVNRCGGTFEITSDKGKGTLVSASFRIDDIDRPPLGDIAETLVTLLGNLGDRELCFYYEAYDCEFLLDSYEVKEELGSVPLNSPEVLVFLREMIKENIKTNFRGVSL